MTGNSNAGMLLIEQGVDVSVTDRLIRKHFAKSGKCAIPHDFQVRSCFTL